MGGAKKRSLSQMEKQQSIRSQKPKQQRRKRTPPKTSQKTMEEYNIPNLKTTDLIDELSKMKAITPYTLASRYDVGISMAKTILQNLEKRGIVKMVASNTNLKLYKPS